MLCLTVDAHGGVEVSLAELQASRSAPAHRALGLWFDGNLPAGEWDSARASAAMLVHFCNRDGFQRCRAPPLREREPCYGPHGANLLQVRQPNNVGVRASKAPRRA